MKTLCRPQGGLHTAHGSRKPQKHARAIRERLGRKVAYRDTQALSWEIVRAASISFFEWVNFC